jgi:hypothetical protein
MRINVIGIISKISDGYRISFVHIKSPELFVYIRYLPAATYVYRISFDYRFKGRVIFDRQLFLITT